MSKTKSFLLAGSISLLLNGCAVSDDPGEGGLLGGIYGLSSGRYEERVEEREERLSSLKALQKEEEGQQQTLEQDKADSKARLADLTAKSRQLQSNLDALTNKIATLRAKTQAAETKRVALVSQSQQLKKDVQTLQASLSDSLSDAQIKKYEAEERRLKQEIAGLESDMYASDLFE